MASENEIRDEALRIMEDEDTVNYILDVFESLHPGDRDVATILLLSIGCLSVKNSNGIQPSIVGKTGAGKTACCEAMLHLVPEEYILGGERISFSLSDKTLFYSKDLKPGTIIFSDDVKLSESLEGTIKRSTGSGFQKGTIHKTVVGKKVMRRKIPPRITWWLTSVEASKNEQLLSRQFVIGIDESKEQDERVGEFQTNKAKTAKTSFPVTEEVKICREIFDEIKQHKLFRVKILFSEHIDGIDKSDRRNLPMFHDMIRAFAVLRYKQRFIEKEEHIILAERWDFNRAKRLWNKYADVRSLNLEPIDLKILETISKHSGISASEIGKEVDRARNTVSYHINGRHGNPGLKDKIVGLTVEKEDNENVYYMDSEFKLPDNKVSWID